MHDTLWADIAHRHGVRRHDPEVWSWRRGQDPRLYGPPPTSLTESVQYAFLQQRVHDLVDDMLGPQTWRLKGKATMFVDCPDAGASWTMPLGWHTDVPVDPSDLWPKFVYAFAFLDFVESRGGATMLLAGSTRRLQLMNELVKVGGHNFKAALARENPWFAELFFPEAGEACTGEISLRRALSEEERTSRLMWSGVVSKGIPMRVEELTGAPGDLLLWDPRALHSASCNTSSRPRSVLKFRLELGPWRQRQMEAALAASRQQQQQ
ncbi:unnamed protein product [Polarella glacialis]|uniref:Phytanoyl-CoA dioxygenase n=1 Tax=Polarella glacialis TaxID=89957 RepID=A0A813L7W4_POLGL|nr:unnamed protein product [Polarella glacialis]